MLPERNRLTARAGFAEAVRRGHRAGTPTVVLHLAADPQVGASTVRSPSGAPAARVGFVVSRSVGGAVVRNRVRRRLRHLLRERLSLLPPGVVVVVRALPAAADAPGPALGDDVDRALSRVLRRFADSGPRPARIPARDAS